MHPCSVIEDREALAAEVADRLRADGSQPYVTAYGASTDLGALGYVITAREIAEQFDTEAPNAIVHASGTGGTQAGLVVGSCRFLPTTDIVGIDIDAEPHRVRSDVLRLTNGLSRRLGLNENLNDRIDVVAGYSGPAYGTPTTDMLEAITMFARLEGLVLDPVYSGKGAAGLIGLIRSGRFTAVDTVVFLHTGGSPGLFAYREVVTDYLASGG